MANRNQRPVSPAAVRTPPAGAHPVNPPTTTTASAIAPQGAPTPKDDLGKAPVFSFPSIITSLGAVGAFAITAIPLAMVFTAHQVEMLYHLDFSTTWYITSLLPRSLVLARLGSILVGWPALVCVVLFVSELFVVSYIERKWPLPDKPTWQDLARYNLRQILPPTLIILIATFPSGHTLADTIPALVVGLLLGTAMALSAISAEELGPLTNQVGRFIWAFFFAYLASLIVTYYSLPRDTHILPAVTLSQDKAFALLGDLIADTNGYWYIITHTPAKVVMLRDDSVKQVTITHY